MDMKSKIRLKLKTTIDFVIKSKCPTVRPHGGRIYFASNIYTTDLMILNMKSKIGLKLKTAI